jgi:tetratricopeptide (TPR) repeat protein
LDGTLLNYRGFLYLSQGRLHDALAVQQQALVALAAQNFGQWRVKALTALAWIHLRLARPDTALGYAEHALVECEKINERRQLAYTLIVRGILRTDARAWAAARQDFAAARDILHGYEMFNRGLEAEVGIAYLDLLEGDHAAALAGGHAVLTHLEAHPMDFTEDVCQVLITSDRIFQQLDPAARPRLCKLIRLHLTTRTATLDAATTTLFWQVPEHQMLRAALQEVEHASPLHARVRVYAAPAA